MSPAPARARVQRLLVGFPLALTFFAFHAWYLPASLEDLDSINFALGMRRFDVARHQPHPPGYPLFILAAKGANALFHSEAKALGALSVLAGTVGVLAVCGLFIRLASDRDWWKGAALLVVTSPLYWLTAERPLSDMAGLAAAVASQAFILGARTEQMIWLAGFGAGFSAGLRSQAAWLTFPLLLLVAARHRRLPQAAAAFGAGVLAWGGPLVIVSGGPSAYWRAIFSQGSEDLTGVRMLWTTPTVRQLFQALYYAFVAPWVAWPIATVVLGLAALGVLWLIQKKRDLLVTIAVGFGPYLLFDLVFQEAVTSRYALPIVVPIGLLAAIGGSWLAGGKWVALALAVATFDAHTGGTSVAAYTREAAPAFRMLSDMSLEASRLSVPPVVSMDRREDLDLRRPLQWLDDRTLRAAERLPSPPQREWLELVKYWNGGGKSPAWFVADPLRTDIDLIDHGQPVAYTWSIPHPVLLSGIRPNEMRWYHVDRPEWYVGEGWALTPEAAGVSSASGKGLLAGSIQGWIHKSVLAGGTLLIGGRNFESRAVPHLSVMISEGMGTTDAVTMKEIAIRGEAFLDFTKLPTTAIGQMLNQQSSEYLTLTLRSSPPVRMAIEQFDASASRTLLGYGPGWHEPEYDPATGRRWRWMSDHGELGLRRQTQDGVLHVEGESPRRYFSRPSRLVIRSGANVLLDRTLWDDFSLDVPLPGVNPDEIITFDTDQVYVPAERRWPHSPDRRRLGLRIFTCDLRPAS